MHNTHDCPILKVRWLPGWEWQYRLERNPGGAGRAPVDTPFM